MISYFQFLLLSLAEKRQYVLEKGTFLLKYLHSSKQIEVYAVNNFIVEFNKDESTGVTEIISYKDFSLLKQHTQQVDITELANIIP